MKIRLFVLTTILFYVSTLPGQTVFPVDLNGVLIPPHSLDLSVYGFQRPQDLEFTATLNDPVELYRDVRLKIYVEHNGKTIYSTDPNFAFPDLRLYKNQPVILDGIALQPYLQPEALTGAGGQGRGSVILPEGLNRIGVEVIDLERNIPISRRAYVTGGFFLNEPPLLQTPACGANLPKAFFQNYLFNWTPMHIGSGNNPGPVEYVFKLVELAPGADPNDGFEFNLQILERRSTSPSLLYGPTDPPLTEGKTYAWRVEAKSMLNAGLFFRNEGKSQVCTFVFGVEGVGGSEQAEEERLAPQTCETFSTDFGPVGVPTLGPAPIVSGDVVKVGYFDLNVSEARATGDGYSGKGYITVPMLRTKLQVEFSNLKAKPNTLRCYEAQDIRALCESDFDIHAGLLNTANANHYFSNDYVKKLHEWFSAGQGRFNKTSLFNVADPAERSLPVGLDKTNAPMIAVTGIRFTPRNCFLTCVGYETAPNGKLLRYVGLDIPVTPYGVKTGSFLSPVDVQTEQVLAKIFTLNYAGGSGNSALGLDCSGFAGYNLQPEFSIDPGIMSSADGGGLVKFRLDEPVSDVSTYLGRIKTFGRFKIPGMPGFEFSMEKAALDLRQNEKLGQNKLAPLYAAAHESPWQGLYLHEVSIILPEAYDFTGNQHKIALNNGGLAVSSEGVYGRFFKAGLIGIDKGKIGNWRYSVDSMSLDVLRGLPENARLAGQIQVPLLDEAFHYSGKLQIGGEHTQFTVRPESGKRSMRLWNATIDLSAASTVRAVMRDFQEDGKKFMPDADLSGLFSLNFSAEEFDRALVGNKSIIKPRLQQLFEYDKGAPSFELKDLLLEQLTIDPYQTPARRYQIKKYSPAQDGLKIAGKTAKLAELRLRYQEAGAGKPEELALEIVVKKGVDLIRFSFIARADNKSGGFVFDRIEVQTDNVECQCIAYQKPDKTDDARTGQMLEKVYRQFYAPVLPALPFQSGSLAGAAEEGESYQSFAAAYKAATLEKLRQNLVGGFPLVDGALSISFLNLQLNFQQTGSNYEAVKAIDRNAPGFTFENINNLPQSGIRSLPLDLTPELRAKMGMSELAVPEGAKLLITDFRIEGSSTPTQANTNVEFCLLTKIGDQYVQFVRKGVKLNASSIDMHDFYLWLDNDVYLNSPLFGDSTLILRKGAKNTGIGAPETDSYAYLLCTGFQGYNVQGEYAVPFSGGELPEARLKMRDLSKNTPQEAESRLRLSFKISQTGDLGRFIAGIRNKTADGKPLEFVLEGLEGVIFKAGKAGEIYLDYDVDKNQSGMPDEAGNDFRGLYFYKIQAEFQGFLKEDGKTMLGADLQNFYFSPLSGFGFNGMGGGVTLLNALDYSKGAKLGGWQYGIDTLQLDFTNAWKRKDQPFYVSGRLRCPLFNDNGGKDLLNFSGVVGFDRDKGEDGNIAYHPGGDFTVFSKTVGKDAVQTEDLMNGRRFKADWIPGILFTLKKGCTVEFEWSSFEDGSQGFMPTAELNGSANIAIGKDKALAPALVEGEKNGSNGGASGSAGGSLAFNLPEVGFEGLLINKPESNTSGKIGGKSGIKTLDLGSWGLNYGGLFERSNRPQPRLQAFPITISTPEISYRKSDQTWLMEIEIAINLLKEDTTVTEERVKDYKDIATGGIAGSTVLGFKFKAGKEEALEYAGIELKEVAVQGIFTAFEVEAVLRFIKDGNEKEWGNGFIGKGIIKMTEGPEFRLEAIVQYGTIQREAPATGSFRYFFADVEGVYKTQQAPHFGQFLVKIPPPIGPIDAVNLHGLGGGFWYNMEKTSPADYKAPEEKETPIGAELENGRGINGFEYTPKEKSYGGYVKGIFSAIQPSILTFDLSLGIEIGHNKSGHMSLKKIFAQGIGYMMIEDILDRDVAPVTLTAEIELDIANARLSGAFKVDAKVVLPDENNDRSKKLSADTKTMTGYDPKTRMIGLRIDPAVSRGSCLVEFKKGGKFYIKAGSPSSAMQGKVDIFGLVAITVRTYLQIGTDIDSMPDVKDIVPGWPDQGSKAAGRSLDPSSGICFGFGLDVVQTFNMGIFYADIRGGVGFDVAMGKTNARCQGKPVGFNGWMLKGQVYAYVGASVGMEFKIGPKRGRVSVMNAFLGASLRGQFPNPTIFNGQLVGRFSVLGGLISGGFNLKFRLASKRDIDCLNEVLSNPNRVLSSLPIISDKYPNDNKKSDIPIFANPKLAYNLNLDAELHIEDVDADGNDIVRIFKPILDPNEGFLLKKGNAVIPCTPVFESKSTTLKPLKMLEPNTNYSISWKVRWQQLEKGEWKNLPDSTSETGRLDFTTGKMPDVIVSDFLDYHAPGRNQRYWHRGYALPRIKFDKAGSNFNWQQVYFPPFKDVKGYGRVNYDYLVRLTRFNAGVEEKIMDIPLSEYPGLKNFQVPVTNYVQVGAMFVIPRVSVQNAQGLNVGFAALDDSLAGGPEWRNKLYRLELIRLPLLPKTATADNQNNPSTSTGTGAEPEFTGSSTEQIRSTSLVTDESKLPQEDGLKILYRYWFATSKYDNLNEKLAKSTVTAYSSPVKRTDFNHPDDATELDFSFTQKDQDFPGFTDDYFGFNCPDEGFDAFDLDRIRLNAAVTYPDADALHNALWTEADGAKRFQDFSDVAFADQINYDYHFGGDFKINFVCNTGTEQIKSYKELLQTDKQLNLVTLKKYWKSRMADPDGKQDWTGKFLLPKSAKNALSEGEISTRTLSYTAYSGKEVSDGWQGEVLSENKTFGLMYQDQRSRILGLQYMTMRASIDKAYAKAVKATVFDRTGEAAVGKIQKRFGHGDEWNDHFWNFKPNRPATYNYDGSSTTYTRNWVYTVPASAHEDFSDVKNWYQTNKTRFAREADLYYKGKVVISLPKLSKWQDMGQTVSGNIALYPQYRVTMYPKRSGGSNESAKYDNNISSEISGADAFRFSRAGKNIFMDTRPADADLISMEIQVSKTENGSDYQRVAFWDEASREVDLYTPSGKRSIKYNAVLPGKDSINLSELFQVKPGDGNSVASWSMDSIYRNHNVRVLLKTAQGAYTWEAGPSAELKPLNNLNQTHNHQRQKAVHLSRGTGSAANMLTLRTIGTEGDLGFGGCLIVDAETRHAAAHLSADYKLTRYQYTASGVASSSSDYVPGAPMLELNPTRNYVVYMAKAGQSQYSASLLLDREAFWQDKVGQFFESGTFGAKELGSVTLPALSGFKVVPAAVPGRIEAEDFGRNSVSALMGEGFAYHDNDPPLTAYSKYRTDENVDIMEEAGIRYVLYAENGEWLAYKINVAADGKYLIDLRIRATGNSRELSMEIDGRKTAFSPLVIAQSNSFITKRIETIDLSAGEHTLKLLFADYGFNLDYIDIKAFAPDVEIKSQGLEILDNSTGYNLNNGTDFGNQPCPAPPRVFTIANRGAGTLKLTGNPVVTLSGPNAADFRVSKLPDQVLEEQASTQFSIEFLPTTANYGERTATVSIKTNAPGSESEFTFNIRATNNPVEAEVRADQYIIGSSDKTPGKMDTKYFDGVLEGNSGTRQFSLHNLGRMNMVVSQSITRDSAAEFIVSNFPAEVPAGGSAAFNVTFSPKADKSGLRTAFLNIKSIDCDENPYIIPLAGAKLGTGLDVNWGNSVQIAPDVYFNGDFTIEAWVNCRLHTFNNNLLKFRNDAGSVALNLSDRNSGKGIALEVTKGAQFQMIASSKALPTDKWTHIAVVLHAGIATLYMDGAACGSGPIQTPDAVLFTQCMLGENATFGVDELRIWNKALSAAQLNAGMNCELKGDEPGLRLYHRFNQGMMEGDNRAFTWVENNRSGATDRSLLQNFALSGNKSNWIKGAPAIKPGNFCTGQYPDLEVRTAAGERIPGNAAAGVLTDFGALKAGESKSLQFKIANIGSAPLNFNGPAPLSLSGPDAAQFSIEPGFSGAAMAPGATGTFSIKFSPTGYGGPRAATLIISNNSNGGTCVLNLKGAIDAPGMELAGKNAIIPNGSTAFAAANNTDFGENSIGGPAVERIFTIKNIGTMPLVLGAVKMDGSAAADFTLEPPVASTLSPGQSIDFTVVFRPQAPGARNATVRIPTNMAGNAALWTFAVGGIGAMPANVLAFDGVDDVLEAAPGNFFNGKFTVEAWVNVRKEQENARLFEFGDASGKNSVAVSLFGPKAGVYAPTPKPVFEIKVNGVKTALSFDKSLILNKWTHIAVVFDGKTAVAYLNGEWNNFGNMQAPSTATPTQCLIGGGKTNMVLDEFRLWTCALEPEEIKARMFCTLKGDEPQLALYYPFNQGIPGGTNASVNFAKQNKTGLTPNGILRNFALSGPNSNWITQADPVQPDACPPVARDAFKVALGDATQYFVKSGEELYNFARRPLLNEVESALYIQNRSEAPLEIAKVDITGLNPEDFYVKMPVARVIPVGGSLKIPFAFKPAALGARQAALEIFAAGQTLPWRGTLRGTGDPSCGSLALDGADDYIQLPGGNYLPAEFTLEAWMAPVYVTGESSFFYVEDASGNNRIAVAYPSISFTKNGAKQSLNLPAVSTGNAWQHFALTVKGRQGKVYLNGQLHASFEADLPQASNWARAVIGNKTTLKLDELRIWDRALSVQEINAHKDCALKGDEPNLLLYFDFNQGNPTLNNADVNYTMDRKSKTRFGTLYNFAFTSSAAVLYSNWKEENAPVSGLCAPYVPAPEIVLKGGEPAADVLRGTAEPAPNSFTHFGTCGVGTETERIFEIGNIGTSDLILTDIALSGPAAADFSLVKPAQMRIAPGATATLGVKFKPGGVGAKSALVSLGSNASLCTFALAGNAVQAGAILEMQQTAKTLETYVGLNSENQLLTEVGSTGNGKTILSGGTLDFGEGKYKVNPILSFNLKNPGIETLNISDIQISGPNADQFMSGEIVNQNTPLTRCSVNSREFKYCFIRFTPQGENGEKNAVLTIKSNSAGGDLVINLKGKKTDPNTEIDVQRADNNLSIASGAAPGNLTDFGRVNVGGQKTLDFNITNATGRDPLRLIGDPKVKISGANAAEFTANLEGDGSSGFLLHILFRPLGQSGARTAVLEIPNNDPDESNYVLNLSGQADGPAPKIELKEVREDGHHVFSPGVTFDLGSVTAGNSVRRDFKMFNTGTGILKLTGASVIDISGADADRFELCVNDYYGGIAANDSYGVSMSICTKSSAPPGDYRALVSIKSDDAAAPDFRFNLRARILPAPEIALRSVTGAELPSGVEINFGKYPVDGTAREIAAFIANLGDGVLQLGGAPLLQLSGPDADQFEIAATPNSGNLAGKSSTAFSMRFKPGKEGPAQAVLSIGSNDADEATYTLVLKGTGVYGLKPDGGRALHFDGQNDWMIPAIPPTFDIDNTTLEFWIKPSSWNKSLMYFSFSNTGGSKTAEVLLSLDNQGNIVWKYDYFFGPSNRGSNSTVLGGPVPLNAWTHLALTRSKPAGGTQSTRIYINGQLKSSAACASISLPIQQLRFGSGGSPSAPGFAGALDELRFWNVGLQEAEIAARRNCELSGEEADLSAYYNFNEGKAGGDNTTPGGFDKIKDRKAGSTKEATTFDFALSGATSNLIAESPVSAGVVCAPPGPPPAPEIELRDMNGVSVADNGAFKLGSEAIGGRKYVSFAVFNAGSANLNLDASPRVALSGPDAGQFEITTQPEAGYIAPGSTALISAAFKPGGSPGTRRAVLLIRNNDADEGNFRINLSAEAIPQPYPALELRNGAAAIADNAPAGPATDFGTVAPGAVKEMVFTIVNKGTGVFNLLAGEKLKIAGPNAPQFSLAQPIAFGSIAPGASEDITLRFTGAGAPGARTATLTVTGDGITYTLNLRAGVNTPPAPEIEIRKGTELVANNTAGTSGVDFGQVAAGESKTLKFSILNRGAGRLDFTGNPGIAIGGTHAAQFSVVPAFEQKALDAGQNADFYVKFSPDGGPGDRLATITVANNDSDESVYRFQVRGHVLQPVSNAETLDFDGIDDYLELPRGTYLNGDFTIEAWVFVKQYKNNARLIELGNGFNDNIHFCLSDGLTGKPMLGMIKGGQTRYAKSNDALPLNSWAHLAVSVQAGVATVYVNGTAQPPVTLFTPGNVQRTQCFIGKNAVGAAVFSDFRLDELRIWNRALTAQELSDKKLCALKGDEAGLEFYLDLNQGRAGENNNPEIFAQDRKKSSSRKCTLKGFSLNGENSNWINGNSPVKSCEN